MSLCIRREGGKRRGGRRDIEGARAAATPLREYNRYEDREAILGEVRHGMGRESKGKKETPGTEQETSTDLLQQEFSDSEWIGNHFVGYLN